MRHTGRGPRHPRLPARVRPPGAAARRPGVAVHFAHRVGAVAVLVAVVCARLRAPPLAATSLSAVRARARWPLVAVADRPGRGHRLTGKAVVPHDRPRRAGARPCSAPACFSRLRARRHLRPRARRRLRPCPPRAWRRREHLRRSSAGARSPADYLELTKPRITLMVVLTALVGFVLAAPAAPLTRCPPRRRARGHRRWWPPAPARSTWSWSGARTRSCGARSDRPAARGPPARARRRLAFGLALTALGLARAGLVRRARWPPRWRSSPGLSYLFALHAAQDAARRSSTLVGAVPGRAAARHRLGGGARHAIEPRRVRPLRDPVPLADPALPGHRLDLPRGLRARRPAHAARARSRGRAHRPPGGGQQPRPAAREPHARRRPAWPAPSTWRARSCSGSGSWRSPRSRSPCRVRCPRRARLFLASLLYLPALCALLLLDRC